MCGIAGIVGPGAESPESRAVLGRMLAALSHRGPDDEGTVVGRGFAVGARRLSIVDLEGGHQPIASDAGNVVASLNGEIYDHMTLRRELIEEGRHFRTRSDTEVLLRLYEERGAKGLEDLEGMFALSIWDGRRETLVLARDRMGEKPLVWFEANGRLVYASEMRALAAHPDAPRGIDDEAVALYLMHRFVPAPRTAIDGIHRLPPGHLLAWRAGHAMVAPYWTLPTPPAGLVPGPKTPAAAAKAVREKFERAVTSRLVGDVPSGVFLSGGLDSAAVAAVVAQRTSLVTFTLRPDSPEFDEGDAAKETAQALGATHHELRVSQADLDAGFDEVFRRVDEPIGDSSLVPTLLLSREARRHVKVVLGGEGADELFGGYPTYLGARMAGSVGWIPGPVRSLASRWIGGRSSGGNVGTRWLVRRLLEGAGQPPLERHMAWFGAFPPDEQRLLWKKSALPRKVGPDLYGPLRTAAGPALETGDPVDALLRVDLLLHLPDALLAKVDRASMLESLEARAPFLEQSLVELAVALPASLKVSRRHTKILLRDAVRDLVPAAVLKRRKRGFAVPVARALAGSLGNRLRERLDSPFARERFEAPYVLTLLEQHCEGRADHGRRLYTLLALLEWAEHHAK